MNQTFLTKEVRGLVLLVESKRGRNNRIHHKAIELYQNTTKVPVVLLDPTIFLSLLLYLQQIYAVLLLGGDREGSF